MHHLKLCAIECSTPYNSPVWNHALYLARPVFVPVWEKLQAQHSGVLFQAMYRYLA